MARHRKVPVVGANVLHPVQIAPQIRHLEAKRTRKASQRAYGPKLRADKQALGATKQEYGTAAASYKGATGMLDQSLAGALAGIQNTGLKGKYAKQVRSELTARLGDSLSSLPYLLAGNREEEGKALLEGRQQLASDRAEMLEHGAQAFNQRLKELRGTGSQAAKEKVEHQESAEKEARKNAESEGRSVNNAALVAENLFHKILAAARSGEKTSSGEAVTIPTTKSQWAAFAQQVAKEAEGADPTAALKAVEALRRHLAAERVAQAARGF